MKKILLSLMTVALVAAVAVGATRAYFSDTETSANNTLTAGAIDLGIDNESYIWDWIDEEMEPNNNTTWQLSFDLDDGQGPGLRGAYQYFAFADVKPGDYGEDTISIHVDNNDYWLCADVTLDESDDNGLTEPEGDDGDITGAAGEGELADRINFIWWADDGDNVLEDNETPRPSGPLGLLGVGGSAVQPITDSVDTIYALSQLDPDSGAMIGAQDYYISKGWCFGAVVPGAVVQDGYGKLGTNGPADRGAGFSCDGSGEDNTTQTDDLSATIAFTAVQAKNNPDFVCGQD